MFSKSLGILAMLALGSCALMHKEEPPPEPACLSLLKIAAEEFVNRAYPPPWSRVGFVPDGAYNDVLCDNPAAGIDEAMMNAVITATDTKTGERTYGIFHIHANVAEPRVLTHAVNLSLTRETNWVPFTEDYEWKNEWCQFLRSYLKDHAAQCGS